MKTPRKLIYWRQAIPFLISIDEALHYGGENAEAAEVGKVALFLEILR